MIWPFLLLFHQICVAKAFHIFCESEQSLTIEGSGYPTLVSLSPSIPTDYLILGSFDTFATLSYDENTLRWSSNSTYNSLQFYNLNQSQLLVPAQPVSQTLYLTVCSFDERKIPPNSLQFSQSPLENCKNFCSSQGNCTNGQCVCSTSYLGDSCNILMKSISDGSSSATFLPAYHFEFFNVSAEGSSLQINTESDTFLFILYSQTSSSALPSFFSCNESFYLASSQLQNSSDRVPDSYLMSLLCLNATGCFYTLNFQDTSMGNSEKAMEIGVIISFAIISGLLSSLLGYLCWKRKRRSSNSIPLENIILMFPETNWSEDMNNETCVICLENFTVKDKIRKLRCIHLFHVRCIDEWIGSHPQCPVCKSKLK